MKTMKTLFCLLMLLAGSTAVVAQTEEERAQEVEAAPADTLAQVNFAADTLAVDTAAAPVPWAQLVAKKIDRLLQNPMFELSQVGLMVYDLTADSAIYCHNHRQRMRPASTMKVVTAVTALDKLGGSYQFKTELCYTGKIENQTLRGDVYCVGGFDPRFNNDDMRAFVESLHKMGVDTIRGRLIADLSMKDADQYGEGWCWDDDNHVLTPLLIGGKNRFMERFEEELRKDGIVLDCQRTTGRCPAKAFQVCTRFHTMDQILMRMMKDSDNLYAESMFYQTAASSGNRPASAASARAITQRLINRMGLRAANYKIADGSGLSLYNYVSAELEVAFLRYAFSNDNIYLHLLPALPIAGKDGTLENRMKGAFTQGNVRAKTGTLTAITSLAGYCTAANGHRLCFAIINQGELSKQNGRAFQDKVCTVLCEP